MGLLSFCLLAIVVAIIAQVTVKLIHQFAPSAPEIISTLVWLVSIVVLAVVLLKALGVWPGHDIPIPRL